ncbi:unnamed protein product [Rotaria sp. Silwood2]|nr:unnamed protein product [Rotaria sp. Silwood2]
MSRRRHENFRELLSKREGFTVSQVSFQNEVLEAHNYYRDLHCAPPLQLDNKLSRSAQIFAEELASKNQFYHSNTKGVGENLYMASGSNVDSLTGKLSSNQQISSSFSYANIAGDAPVTDWYNEIEQYDFDYPGFSGATGHFTQVVWKISKNLGVGIAYTSEGDSVYVVAQYTPPGNYQDQFPDNVFPEGQC